MTDVLDPASLIDAAQKAVGDGDYVSAERMLREAASVQEARLGSSHPDLASTLNNLAFVCERMNKFDEAERGYRRAHAIAVASLSPGHPFIKTSLSNLVEFCAARGIPIWTPPAAQSADQAASTDIVAPSQTEAGPDEGREPAAAAGRWPFRTIAAAALGVAAVVAIVFTRQGQDATDLPGLQPQVQPESPRHADPVVSTATPLPRPASEPPVKPAPRPDSSAASVTVLNAQLCSALEKAGSPDWQCAAATGDLQPGTYLFYTRLLTTTETTVEHRWYQGDRVHQVMRLRVTPSPGNGYRTFSGNTIRPERAGDWKVELRTSDGGVIHQERFVVR
jgi:hypothetical protein